MKEKKKYFMNRKEGCGMRNSDERRFYALEVGDRDKHSYNSILVPIQTCLPKVYSL
jgi:hypothetical protein